MQTSQVNKAEKAVWLLAIYL